MITSFFRHFVVVVAIVLGSGCNVEILHDIDEPQANTTLAVLQQAGIAAQKQRVTSGSKATYTIEVGRGDAPRAWQLLRRHNLPRDKTQGLGEVFGAQASLVPSQTEQQALLRHALAGELTKTLQSIDGVREARVHVVLPRRNPLASPDTPRPKPRAAVLLKVAGKPALTVAQVQRLVAGSVEGLEASAVEVVLAPQAEGAKRATEPAALAGVGPFRVAATSRGGLLLTLILAIVLILAFALATLVMTLRYRALARRLADEDRAGRATSADLDASLSLLGRSFQDRDSVRLGTRSRLEPARAATRRGGRGT